MPESVKMILVLTLISGAAGMGLAKMNDITEPLAQENVKQFTLSSINTVIPESDKPDACEVYQAGFDNAPNEDAICIDNTTIYRARKGDEIVGIAVEAVGENAYSGTITVLVGLKMADGMLTGLKVLQHAETPGLGSLMTNCEFQQQMVGNKLGDINWTVAKDGGDIDQLSGATITSRSMLDSIHKAQALWKEQSAKIKSEPAKGACNGK